MADIPEISKQVLRLFETVPDDVDLKVQAKIYVVIDDLMQALLGVDYEAVREHMKRLRDSNRLGVDMDLLDMLEAVSLKQISE